MALSKFDKSQLDKDGVYYKEWLMQNAQELQKNDPEIIRQARKAAFASVLEQLKK